MSSSLLSASPCVVRVIELLYGEVGKIIQLYFRYPEEPAGATKKHCNCYTHENLL